MGNWDGFRVVRRVGYKVGVSVIQVGHSVRFSVVGYSDGALVGSDVGTAEGSSVLYAPFGVGLYVGVLVGE